MSISKKDEKLGIKKFLLIAERERGLGWKGILF